MTQPPERYVAYFLGVLRKLHLWKGAVIIDELSRYHSAIYKLVDRQKWQSRERTHLGTNQETSLEQKIQGQNR